MELCVAVENCTNIALHPRTSRSTLGLRHSWGLLYLCSFRLTQLWVVKTIQINSEQYIILLLIIFWHNSNRMYPHVHLEHHVFSLAFRACRHSPGMWTTIWIWLITAKKSRYFRSLSKDCTVTLKWCSRNGKRITLSIPFLQRTEEVSIIYKEMHENYFQAAATGSKPH